MKPRPNPLAILLRTGGDGDEFAGDLLIAAIRAGEPEARGRECGWYRDGSTSVLIYDTPEPDLSGIPASKKILILDSQQPED